MRDITEIRKDIDGVDQQLLSLLVQRADFVKEIIKFKIENNLAILDRARETKVIENKLELNAGRLDNDLVKKIFKLIMSYSRRQQRLFIKNK